MGFFKKWQSGSQPSPQHLMPSWCNNKAAHVEDQEPICRDRVLSFVLFLYLTSCQVSIRSCLCRLYASMQVASVHLPPCLHGSHLALERLWGAEFAAPVLGRGAA